MSASGVGPENFKTTATHVSDCAAALLNSRSRLEIEPIFEVSADQIPYYLLKSKTKQIDAKAFFPHFPLDRRLIVGFDSAHSYLQYDGFLIDSSGIPGLLVRSSLRKSDVLRGELVAVIHDLSDTEVNDLKHLIQKFETISRLTCAATTCSYIKDYLPGVIPAIQLRTTSLVASLIQYKRSGGNIEFVVINRSDISEAIKIQEDGEGRAICTAGSSCATPISVAALLAAALGL